MPAAVFIQNQYFIDPRVEIVFVTGALCKVEIEI